MQIIKNILSIIGLISVSGLFIFAVQEAPSDDEVNKEKPLVNDYKVYALEIPDELDFAGEDLPLENPDIYERMDRELLVNTYWQSNGLLMFKRAQKYFPIIEPILAKNGIPDDFKYLAVIESGLTNAVSPAGARGVWQIMPATGRENGLEVNKNVDERYNLELATEVACKYLIAAKKRLGSWTLAAAAYNGGNAGIARRLKAQNVNDYYDLLLGEETGRYVFRIVALKEILSNASKYGFNFRSEDLYKPIPTFKVEVDTAVTNFANFSEKFGINYKILKIHNPWLREAHLNNKSRKLYKIAIPEEGYYK
ncbi:lytic transglycosylase domain-containing protein [Winogradskyella immobilis]|uniref:Lytic transglycosylase domain-containing protein n=1 Tax=Winogradskyella immobilis TaxID=2816852 RepID=A0ABS8EMM6_9FLAO|nr:lytic transglycosylase domain-containing protein [Winogradskyella immobilis]MCC1483567.1 lytic transglycosylase domain-containing protein [Winogradskyella immobilis]MCG0015661.1 lytic transglycosylase domain-containing protein [Winogradskyella immobilis]